MVRVVCEVIDLKGAKTQEVRNYQKTPHQSYLNHRTRSQKPDDG